MWTIPLTEPDLGVEEEEAVCKVLRSKWLTMGEVTAEFERRFAEKMQVKHALAVSNCTAALHMANVALGVGHGDEVICPGLTFVASANATRYTGAAVVFADVISRHDPTIDPRDIERKITPNTKAITVVHYAGFSCAMEEIASIARRNKVAIIEDCAHAPFATCRFRDGQAAYVGAIGDVGCFSFFSNKNLTTGEGGMVTTNNDRLAERLRLFRSHGMTAPTLARHTGHASGYDVVALGYNYRIDEIRAAIGLCQLSKLDASHERRRQVYAWYLEEFAGEPDLIMPFRHRDLNDASCHIAPLFAGPNANRVRSILKEHGIQTSRHYELVPALSLYREANTAQDLMPTTDLITLPLSSFMSVEQVKKIARLVKEAVARGSAATSVPEAAAPS